MLFKPTHDGLNNFIQMVNRFTNGGQERERNVIIKKKQRDKVDSF